MLGNNTTWKIKSLRRWWKIYFLIMHLLLMLLVLVLTLGWFFFRFLLFFQVLVLLLVTEFLILDMVVQVQFWIWSLDLEFWFWIWNSVTNNRTRTWSSWHWDGSFSGSCSIVGNWISDSWHDCSSTVLDLEFRPGVLVLDLKLCNCNWKGCDSTLFMFCIVIRFWILILDIDHKKGCDCTLFSFRVLSSCS
jgi:hypothetical protein